MNVGIGDRRLRYAVFFLLALAINLIDGALTSSVSSLAKPGSRMLVAVGACVDVIVIVTAIYYWLVVRPGLRTPWSLIPVAAAGVLHATYLHPNGAAARPILAGICELGLIGFVIVQLRKASRRHSADLVETVRQALAPILSTSIANLAATEYAVLYYALFSWRAKAHVPAGAKAFSIHERTNQPDLFFALAFASLIEILPVHLLLSHWSPMSAWIVTGVSLYGAIWALGIARSFARRPALVGPDYLDLRYGLWFRLRAPADAIRGVHRIDRNDVGADVVVPKKSEPNLRVELVAPLEAEGPFGLLKRVSHIAFTADDVEAFQHALEELTGGPELRRPV